MLAYHPSFVSIAYTLEYGNAFGHVSVRVEHNGEIHIGALASPRVSFQKLGKGFSNDSTLPGLCLVKSNPYDPPQSLSNTHFL